jgi:hypothetical protein
MPISEANLRMYLSGGGGNSDPAASLGGDISSTELVNGLNNLFGDVSGDEALAGVTDYRCIYFRNLDSDADGLIDPFTRVSSDTPSPDSTISLGLDPAGKNAQAQTVASATDAPIGVSFSGGNIPLPSGPYIQNDYVAIWVRRVVNAGANPSSSNPAVIEITGDMI